MKLPKIASICTVFLFLSTARAIWNGATATINQFPYSALIVANYDTRINDLGEWDCSGALVSDMFVITAAQCVKGIGKFRIKLGGHYNGRINENRSGNYVYDHIMWTKPYYFQATANSTNELAMIALKPKVNFTNEIQPVYLALPSLYNFTNSNYTAVATGWGVNLRHSKALQYVNMQTIPDSDCTMQYQASDTNTMFCAEGVVTDDKQGIVCRDVGAPLVVYDIVSSQNDKNFVLIGISLYTRPCDEDGPELFARIDWFVDWIRRVDLMKFNKTLYPYYSN